MIAGDYGQFRYHLELLYLHPDLKQYYVPLCMRRDGKQGARWYSVEELLADSEAIYNDIMPWNFVDGWTIELKPATFLEPRGRWETGRYDYAAYIRVIQFDCDGTMTMQAAIARMTMNSVPPNVVKYSSAGEKNFHCFWVLRQPIRLDENGIGAYRKVALSLAESFGGDPQMQSAVQPLRACGTFNVKHDPPYLNAWDWFQPDVYDLEDFAHIYSRNRPQARHIEKTPATEEQIRNRAHQQILARLSQLQTAKEGQRNIELNAAATYCAKRADAAGLTNAEVEQLLVDACIANGYTNDDTRGMHATIKSALGATGGNWHYAPGHIGLTERRKTR